MAAAPDNVQLVDAPAAGGEPGLPLGNAPAGGWLLFGGVGAERARWQDRRRVIREQV